MAKNPTVASLIAKAIELNSKLTEDQVRGLIKEHNVRSFSKMETVVAAVKTRKTRSTEVKLVEPGPRGFRFGSTFIQSVIEGAGVAAVAANKNKLIAFAETIGVQGVTMKTDAAEALKAMKAAAKKYFNEHFAAAA